MSSTPDMDLDLENLFQPAWAQEKPAANRYEKFTGNEGVKPDRRRGQRQARRTPRPAGGLTDRRRSARRRSAALAVQDLAIAKGVLPA